MSRVSLQGCGAIRLVTSMLLAAMEEKEFLVCAASCWCDLVGPQRMRLLCAHLAPRLMLLVEVDSDCNCQ